MSEGGAAGAGTAGRASPAPGAHVSAAPMWFFIACAEPEEDTAEEVVVQDTEEREPCELIDIDHDESEPDPPAVGDSWTLFMWCDDMLLTGTARISVDPVDAAALDENVITFLVAGDLELTMQTGTYKTTETVTVLDG